MLERRERETGWRLRREWGQRESDEACYIGYRGIEGRK